LVPSQIKCTKSLSRMMKKEKKTQKTFKNGGETKKKGKFTLL
jgi:hypothetical protein